VTISGSVRVDAYAVVERAVEDGARAGVARWLRHREQGLVLDDRAALEEHIEREVLAALCDVLRFEAP